MGGNARCRRLPRGVLKHPLLFLLFGEVLLPPLDHLVPHGLLEQGDSLFLYAGVGQLCSLVHQRPKLRHPRPRAQVLPGHLFGLMELAAKARADHLGIVGGIGVDVLDAEVDALHRLGGRPVVAREKVVQQIVDIESGIVEEFHRHVEIDLLADVVEERPANAVVGKHLDLLIQGVGAEAGEPMPPPGRREAVVEPYVQPAARLVVHPIMIEAEIVFLRARRPPIAHVQAHLHADIRLQPHL